MDARPSFLTPALSGWLDLIRAIAALAVVIGHAYQLGIYTGPYPFSEVMQLSAVIIFFVLSGLVIAHSSAKPGMTAGSYAAARIARILPVALPALLLSLLAALWCESLGLRAEPITLDPGGISIKRALVAALFLDESLSAGLAINPPWWSLSYEVWYYLLFGIAIFTREWKRVIFLPLAAAIAGPRVLLMLPIWLLGVALARSNPSARVSRREGFLRLCIAIVTLHFAALIDVTSAPYLVDLVPWNLGHSHYALGEFLIAIAVAIGFTGLRAVVGGNGHLPDAMADPVRWMANMSFSLYLMHWPVLTVLKANGITAGESLAGFAAILTFVVLLCGLFARLTEHQREPFRRWLEARLGCGQRINTSSSAIEGCKATV